MSPEYDWQTGENLISLNDPAELDAAFDRGEPRVGTAVIGLVLSCGDLAVAAPRVERALRSSDPFIRQYAFVAVGDAARLYGGLTPAIYEALRAEGLGGVAEHAIRDALTFVPFRDMPWWLKRLNVTRSVKRFFVRRWLYAIEDVMSAFGTLRKLFSRRRSG